MESFFTRRSTHVYESFEKVFEYVYFLLLLIIIGCLVMIIRHQPQDFYSYLIQDISQRDGHFETIEKINIRMDYILFLILMIKLKAICLFMKMFRIYG